MTDSRKHNNKSLSCLRDVESFNELSISASQKRRISFVKLHCDYACKRLI
jgi:hypothetical protein